jgi:Putative zinc-finger
MNCAELEILICDYVDGTLTPARQAEVARHLDQCPACAELARDSAAAVAFMERAADVEPPPELITKILYDAPWSKGHVKPAGLRRRLGAFLGPVLHPKFAMGMAMTILSLSLLKPFVAPGLRQLKPADLSPSAVWTSLDDRAHRAWARTVKYYDNLKVVYQIQTMLREWQQQDEEQRPAATPQNNQENNRKTDDRKLPVKASPEPIADPVLKR